MILAQYSNITFGYHDKLIVRDFSLQLKTRCRVGFIGDNGSGKTTLLRVLTGELEPDSGSIFKAKDLKIGYLKQTPDFPGETTLGAVLHKPFKEIFEMENQLEELQQKMSDKSSDSQLEKYDRLQETFDRAGGYLFRSRIERVRTGMGFSSEDMDRRISTFSGGEQARIMLARLLLEEPDLMLLDEPTNHLDIDAVEYLENYLEEFKGGVLIISHDRYFLDKVTSTIVELAWKKCEVYSGNYSFYRKEKERRDAVKHKHFKEQQKHIEKLEDYINRNMAAQKTKQAQSRLKELERIDRLEDVKGSRKSMSLRLNMIRTSGQIVFEVKNVSKSFDSEELLRKVNLKVHRGNIIGIIGPNGSGKTTLLRMLTGETLPDDGEVEWGYQVYKAYYDQHLRDLRESCQVIDEIWDMIPSMTQQEVRDHLGRFLFSGDDVFKEIGPLSGGEKARVALAKLFLKDANLLLLDEPTNHLDLPARESLETALKEYPGTVVMVTHDRYLLDRIADRIWVLEEKTFSDYPGNYSDYKHLRTLQTNTEQDHDSDKSKTIQEKQGLTRRELRKARAELRKKTGKSSSYYEREIDRIEDELNAVRASMQNPANATDWNALHEMEQHQAQLQEELNSTMELWETAVEAEAELEALN